MLEEIIQETRKLSPVSSAAATAYDEVTERLTAEVNRALDSRAGVFDLIGQNPLEMMHINHQNHSRFMSNVFKLNNFELLARTVPWVYRAYRGHGFSYDYFPIELNTWKDTIEKELGPDRAASILAVYDWLLKMHERMIAVSEAEKGTTLDVLLEAEWLEKARRFLSALLAPDINEALNLADGWVREPGDLESFYLNVVKPCMYQIGTLWETDEISVAQEHLATAIVGRIMASFYPKFLVEEKTKGKALVTSAPNEFHELGARMVADLLEIDGWDTTYLGANMPSAELKAFLGTEDFTFMAISVMMPFNIDRAQEIIGTIRGDSALPELKIMVGGRMFGEIPDLWRSTGADGWAPDPVEAVKLARSWWN